MEFTKCRQTSALQQGRTRKPEECTGLLRRACTCCCMCCLIAGQALARYLLIYRSISRNLSHQ